VFVCVRTRVYALWQWKLYCISLVVQLVELWTLLESRGLGQLQLQCSFIFLCDLRDSFVLILLLFMELRYRGVYLWSILLITEQMQTRQENLQ
jgi:hypothetical protein